MLAPVAVAVGSMVLYHVVQKSLSNCISPFGVLTVAYFLAMILSYLAAAAQGKAGLSILAQDFNPWVILLGIAIVGIEIGVLWTYRSGMLISHMPLIIAGAVPLCVLPIGIIMFKERLSWHTLAGGALVFLGLWIMHRR